MSKASVRPYENPQTGVIIYNAIFQAAQNGYNPQAKGRSAEVDINFTFHSFSKDLDLNYIPNSNSFRYEYNKQVRLKPKVKTIDSEFKGDHMVPDASLINKRNNNTLYIESKNYQKIPTSKWIKIAKNYKAINEHVVFILSGDCSNDVGSFNCSLANEGLFEYALGIKLSDFEKFCFNWSNQFKTDLKALKILMSH